MDIRHPRKGDILPLPLEFTGNFDPDWIWQMGNAILVCAPAHDTVLLLRLVRFGDMPSPLWTHRLLQHVLRECRERGFQRYMTWLADDVEMEEKLREICEQQGAHFDPFKGNILIGRI